MQQIETAKRQIANLPSPTELRLGEDEFARPILGLPHTDIEGWKAQMMVAFGTASGAFVDAEIGRMLQVFNTLQDDLPLETKINAALAVIQSVSPRNEIEAMLASQMVMTHLSAMRMLGELNRLRPIGSPGAVAVAGTVSARLLRAFSGQVEALHKLRRPAVQTVRVERVNVNAGGQAVIGTVPPPGGYLNREDQAYGTQHQGALGLTAGTTLRSEETEWAPLYEAESQRSKPLQAPRRSGRKRGSER